VSLTRKREDGGFESGVEAGLSSYDFRQFKAVSQNQKDPLAKRVFGVQVCGSEICYRTRFVLPRISRIGTKKTGQISGIRA
jgi:hypothetical protein